MKKLLLLPLYLLMLTGCSDSDGDSPVIAISAIYVNDGEANYSNKIHTMPLLSTGDVVRISFLLNGNGDDLRTFKVSDEHRVSIKMTYEESEISTDFTDLDNGVLAFIDGVSETGVTVQITILEDKEDEIPLSFYLFSQATNVDGASVSIVLKTKAAGE